MPDPAAVGPSEARRRPRRPALGFAAFGVLLALALAPAACTGLLRREPDPMRYRLAGSGTHWDVVGRDRVLEDLRPRYPEFFALVLDPGRSEEPDLLELRDDLERTPVTRRNYDALNAVAIAYFELNYRGEAWRGSGHVEFLSAGFRASKLAAVPWRAYGEIDDGALRDAILDFFADAGTGEKLGAGATAGRLVDIVGSLARKETDPERLERIRRLEARIRARLRAADEPRGGRGAGP